MQVCCVKPQLQTPSPKAAMLKVSDAVVQSRFGFVGALVPALEQAVLSTAVKSVGSVARVTDSFDGISSRPASQQAKQEAINLATIAAFTFGFRMLFKTLPNKYAESAVWMAAYAVSETTSRVFTVASQKKAAKAEQNHHSKSHGTALQGSAMETVVLPAASANNAPFNRQTAFGNTAFSALNTGAAPLVSFAGVGQPFSSLPKLPSTFSSTVPNPFMVA